jgi:hypothetical protein
MIDHLKELPDFLAEELEEQQFEASVREAIPPPFNTNFHKKCDSVTQIGKL